MEFRMVFPMLRILRLFCLAAMCLWGPASGADPLRCTLCSKRLAGRYLTSGGKSFCSQSCYTRTLPACAVCANRIQGRYITSEGKVFCSDRCFESTLPQCEICRKRLRQAITVNDHIYCRSCTERPGCFVCALPTAKGVKLQDGRVLCQTCRPQAVFTRAQARSLYLQARTDVAAVTGMQSGTLPPFQLVDVNQIKDATDKRPTATSMVLRGLYLRQETVTETKNILGMVLKKDVDVTEKVMLLYGLTKDAFLATAAHELTHDLLAENYPQLKNGPLWVEEGICQYVAAAVCRRRGLKDTLRDIETCPDPDYGDGYRYFSRLGGNRDWSRIQRWLAHTDVAALPATAPTR